MPAEAELPHWQQPGATRAAAILVQPATEARRGRLKAALHEFEGARGQPSTVCASGPAPRNDEGHSEKWIVWLAVLRPQIGPIVQARGQTAVGRVPPESEGFDSVALFMIHSHA
jgi:hypothetical protein